MSYRQGLLEEGIRIQSEGGRGGGAWRRVEVPQPQNRKRASRSPAIRIALASSVIADHSRDPNITRLFNSQKSMVDQAKALADVLGAKGYEYRYRCSLAATSWSTDGAPRR